MVVEKFDLEFDRELIERGFVVKDGEGSQPNPKRLFSLKEVTRA